jgi:hypothetical protein
MIQVVPVAVATVALAFLTSLGCGSAPSGSQRTEPSPGPMLRLVALDPPTLSGSGFRPRERVTLLVSAGPGKSTSRRVTAGSGGGFTVTLPSAASGCDALVVQAIGARGSRAMVDVTQPHCATP